MILENENNAHNLYDKCFDGGRTNPVELKINKRPNRKIKEDDKRKYKHAHHGHLSGLTVC